MRLAVPMSVAFTLAAKRSEHSDSCTASSISVVSERRLADHHTLSAEAASGGKAAAAAAEVLAA